MWQMWQMWSGTAIEQVSIKSMKGQGGLTYDRGITESVSTK